METRSVARAIAIAVSCVVILFLGIGTFFMLPLFRQEPAQAEPRETAMPVEAIEVEPEAVQTLIRGYGTVRPVTTVELAPEVGGRVVETHPNLEVGKVVPAGETLFRIDPRSYEAQVADLRSTAEQLRASIGRLRIQYETDRARLQIRERNRDLARQEFERLRELFETDEVGTRSGVEQAERAYNAAQDELDRLEMDLRLYPVQIEEAQRNLEAAQARQTRQEIDLDRTEVKAPFDARIRTRSIRTGQYVSAGSKVLSLSDDSVLELSVPLNSGDARRWLQFNNQRINDGKAWFTGLEPVEVRIRWTEDDSHFWYGQVARVEQFDEGTRTLTVAVQVPGENAVSAAGHVLPLVEGMFCEVEIPGRTLDSVYRVPRSAVSFQSTVYTANENRLQTVPVVMAYERDGEAVIAEGLNPGDHVVTTRLVNPLENAQLRVTLTEPRVVATYEELPE